MKIINKPSINESIVPFVVAVFILAYYLIGAKYYYTPIIVKLLGN